MTRPENLRRVLLFLLPTAFTAKLLPAQRASTGCLPADPGCPDEAPPGERPEDVRLPNGKNQRDAILKADYQENLKDAQELATRAKDFQKELEKSDRYVLSLGLLKELDEIDKIARRIRGRMRRY